MPAEHFDIVIVGGGPAGASVALHLAKIAPQLAARCLLIDSQTHPREKLCGGGITYLGQHVLEFLKLEPQKHLSCVDVRKAVLRHRTLPDIPVHGRPVFRIFQRSEFDHWLLKKVAACGVTVSQGEGLISYQPNEGAVAVTTSHRDLTAGVLVAADGVNSRIARAAFKSHWNQGTFFSTDSNERPTLPLCALVETLTRENAQTCSEFIDHRAVFDFSVLAEGVSGYAWDFPSMVAGKATMNRGIFDNFRPINYSNDCGHRRTKNLGRINLRRHLEQRLAQTPSGNIIKPVSGCGFRIYQKKQIIARHRLILCGDAAGADPLFGEGISFALAHGKPVCQSIVEAYTSGDFSFSEHHHRVARVPQFRHLAWRSQLAKLFYRNGPLQPLRQAAIWRLAAALLSQSRWADARFDPVKALADSNSPFGHFMRT